MSATRTLRGPQRVWRPVAAALALGVTAAGLAWLAPLSTASAVEGTQSSAWSRTKTLTREFGNADGTVTAVRSNKVTVKVSATQNLRGRQRVTVSWSGAQPSAGRAANPFGENGLAQEYPVVVMQCRGTDEPGAKLTVSPSTCWTVSTSQRSRIAVSEGDALWTRDLLAEPADRAQYSSALGTLPTGATCADADKPPFFTRLTPFVAANGTVYQACDSTTMPPEAAVGAAYPANEVAAFTRTDGTGDVQFEVRSDSENESLGCNDTTACSIVVIPINGLSCAAPEGTTLTVADKLCRRSGQFLPGTSNFRGDGVDAAVSPQMWWSASNWANRFTVPISFGLPPDTCEVLDSRAPTAFYGSELLSQAALQWAPAYCLAKDRFKYQHNVMSDEAGWNLMENGGGAAAVVSSGHEQRGEDPVAYAPSAVTGFSIGYVIDKPENAGEVTQLKLNARLIAKLMTQSYLGSDLGRGHPGIEGNPLGLMTDPEFQKLNPGLSHIEQEAGAALLNLSNASDVITQLTEYLATDPAAVAWINGEPDPWGMVVNPAYRRIHLPRSEWPLLDDYVPATENECRLANPSVYFTQLAAPVVSLRKIAEALLDGWPNVQTKCDYDVSTKVWKVGRTERQPYGARFMLGVVSLGDSARFGLRNAALQTKGSTFVEPTAASLQAAIKLSQQTKDPNGPFVMTQEQLRKAGTAYPGTMVVYTAARTRNLDRTEAGKVADFIRISTTEGQVPGAGNGQLPEGFLPIRKSGVTAKLFAAAQSAAAVIEAQKAPARPEDDPSGKPSQGPPENPGPGPTGPGLPDGSGGDPGTGAGVPDEVPSAPAGSKAPSAAPTAGTTTDLVPTAAVTSGAGDRVMLGLLGIGLLAGLVAAVSRILVRVPGGRR